MEDRKRRMTSPAPSENNVSQKRKLSVLSMPVSAPEDIAVNIDERSAGDVDASASVGLEEGFLEVSWGTPIIERLQDIDKASCCGLLQSFRKAALHRQMLEYRREWERTQAKAERLEKDLRDSQARLSQVEECWRQVCMVYKHHRQSNSAQKSFLYALLADK